MNTIDSHFPKHYQDMAVENTILGISGSPRKNGNSDIMLKTVLEGAAASRVTTGSLYLRDISFSSCIGCEKCRKDKICTGLQDGMSFVYPQVLASRGLVLVSPTHNYNITAWMKAFIDRLYCFYHFENTLPRAWSSRLAGQNRKAVIIGICEQENREDMGFTLEAMEQPLTALGYDIVSRIPVYRVFSKGAVKHETRKMEEAYRAGVTLSKSLMRG